MSSAEWSVTLPGGETTSVDDVQSPEGVEVDPMAATLMLQTPGRYSVVGKRDEGDDYLVTLIAGLPASESRTEMLPVGQLQVLGIGVESDLQPADGAVNLEDDASKGQLSASDLEEKQKWWRWLLLAGLGCLVLESLWASAIERRQSAEA